MSSVTHRIEEIRQPRGGYIKLSSFNEIPFEDGIVLTEKENISPILVGLAVEYLTRIAFGEPPETALSVSMKGFSIAEILGEKGSSKAGIRLIKGIKGLDDKSITSICKLVSFDVWARNPEIAPFSRNYKEISPDSITINNIRVLVNRSISFFNLYGPIIKSGFSFEKEGDDTILYEVFLESDQKIYGGYTRTVDHGEGDFLTKDTLWDFKVSVSKPKPKHTLQILMYWIMGQHSGQHIFRGIKKIGIFNPRLNVAYILDTNDIPADTIKTIEKDVICY